MTSATTSHTVDPEIYKRSGDVSKHLDGVKKQYDTEEKREFYAHVMGDGKEVCAPFDIDTFDFGANMKRFPARKLFKYCIFCFLGAQTTFSFSFLAQALPIFILASGITLTFPRKELTAKLVNK